MTHPTATIRFSARRGPSRRRAGSLALPVTHRGRAKPTAADAGLFLTALVLLLQTSCAPSRTELVKTFYEAEGYGVGKAVAEALPDGGQVVVIPTANQPKVLQDMMAARLRGLSSAVPKPAYTITTAEGLAVEEQDRSEPDFISLNRFTSCLDRYPDAVALVSFDAFPFRPGEIAVPPDIPVFMGAAPYESTAAALLQPGVIHAYLRLRAGVDPRAKPPPDASLEEAFASRYELVSNP